MRWKVEFSTHAAKGLRKLDPQDAKRIRGALAAVATLEDPRTRGKPLTGNLSGLWRYRVGDYRVICDIFDDELAIVAIEIGHRSRVYD